MKEMNTGQFKTLAAKDIVIKQFGPQTKDWPEHNFWTLVSTTKALIQEKHMPDLLARYQVTINEEV